MASTQFSNHLSLLSLPFGPGNNRVSIGSPKFSMTSAFYSNLKMDQNLKKSIGSCRPQETSNFEVSHPIKPEKVEMFKSMEKWAENNILTLLKPVTKSWHPQDLLPDPSSEGFFDQVRELRERTKEIPDDYLVVLIGDMITEEALPTYQSHFSTIDVFGDGGCTSDTPWAIWTRAWSAEENRHGDLLNKYLYLSGRVDMKQVETTIHYLIGSGMDIGSKDNPYLWTIYTSFQERATFISHGNTAKLAMKYGDQKLAQVCGTIAAEEKRHEQAYTRITKKLFELDPNDTVIAFAHMMKRKITMPAHFMYDGQDDSLFSHFSSVAMKIGVYTTMDYIEILEHLVAVWDVDKLSYGLNGDGREAQDYVCGLARRLRKMDERAHGRTKEVGPLRFSWIYNNEVKV